ncbi:MAG: hypothetical protein NT018_06475 [Armatimonadetes bacterium]|nr:hypothetical protein [Armatimonadota bacterium]
MIINNSTAFEVTNALQEAFSEYPTEGLVVELKYCPKGSKRYISGTYYRRAKGFEDGRLIRLRINRHNMYPLKVQFKTSSYYVKRSAWGKETTYQNLRTVEFETPGDLIIGILAHEFSHYLDHIEGLNGRFKQTKADKFAMAILEKLKIVDGVE